MTIDPKTNSISSKAIMYSNIFEALGPSWLTTDGGFSSSQTLADLDIVTLGASNLTVTG